MHRDNESLPADNGTAMLAPRYAACTAKQRHRDALHRDNTGPHASPFPGILGPRTRLEVHGAFLDRRFGDLNPASAESVTGHRTAERIEQPAYMNYMNVVTFCPAVSAEPTVPAAARHAPPPAGPPPQPARDRAGRALCAETSQPGDGAPGTEPTRFFWCAHTRPTRQRRRFGWSTEPAGSRRVATTRVRRVQAVRDGTDTSERPCLRTHRSTS